MMKKMSLQSNEECTMEPSCGGRIVTGYNSNNERKSRLPQMGNPPKRIRYTSHNDDNEIEDRYSDIFQFQPRQADDLFTCLPSEVITHVISYLTLRDRKTVRLTCSTLNECSKHVSITKEEKLVIPGSCTVSSAYVREILSRTNSAVLNLEFRARLNSVKPMDNIPDGIWRKCGDRIRSLRFYYFPETHVLFDILLNCHGLQVIEFLRHYRCHYRFYASSSLQLSSVLNDLNELNITRTELRFLTFREPINDNLLLRTIFMVFPNLKYLRGTFDDLELNIECLKPLMQLQSLTYEVYPPLYARSCRGMIRHWDYKKEQHQEIYNHHFPVSSDSSVVPPTSESFLIRFLAVQNELEELNLLLPSCIPFKWRKELMLHVLRSSPKLREFSFSTYNMDLKTSDEANEFVDLISNLRILRLGTQLCTPNGLALPPTKLALRMLVVAFSSGRDEFLFHILKYSPKMQHLMIYGTPTTEKLREITKNLPELRSLVLEQTTPRGELTSHDSDEYCYEEVFLNLEYLEVLLEPSKLPLLQKILFPRVKYFKLTFTWPYYEKLADEVFMDEFRRILWNMPALEIACLPGLGVEELREPIEFFQNSKNLRHFICNCVINKEGLFEESVLRCMFESCPTLKFVSETSYHRTFSYESSTKHVISEPLFTAELLSGMRPKFEAI